MRKVLFAAVALTAAAMTGVLSVGTEAGSDTRPTRYIVLYEAGASPAAVKAAVTQAKGRILKANNKVGVATVISSNATVPQRCNQLRSDQGRCPQRPDRPDEPPAQAEADARAEPGAT